MSEQRSLIDPVDDRIIHLTTVLPNAPPAIFRYFTSPKLLVSWLAERANVEPRVGGLYELFWEPDDPENNSTIGCRITAFAEDQLIAFEWRSPRQFKRFANGADPLTHVVVSLSNEELEGTTVHLIHSGWRSTSEWEEARVWQMRAWEMAFEQLEQRLKELRRF